MSRCSLIWLFVCLVLVGCGQAKKTEPAAPAVVSVVAPTPPKVETPKTDLIATAAEGSAESTFQKTLVAFQDGRFDAAYDFLPGSYQNDVQNLVHEFAETMDAELWSKSFTLLSKTANILKTKKEMILSNQRAKRAPIVENLKPYWDSIASGFYDVTTSEIADLTQLKQCDVMRLLASASKLVKGANLPKFGDVTVTTVKSDDKTATLSFHDSSDSEPKQVEFIKVEGKWLPKSIAEGWPSTIEVARSNLKKLPEQISALKPMLMKQFEGMSSMLDKLQQAKTNDEFDAAITPLEFSIALGAMMADQIIQEKAAQSRTGVAIHVVINREMKDSEQTSLKDAVLTALGDPKINYEIFPGNGKTRFRFNPIPSGELLVSVLQKQFVGANIRFDSEAKAIHVELKATAESNEK